MHIVHLKSALDPPTLLQHLGSPEAISQTWVPSFLFWVSIGNRERDEKGTAGLPRHVLCCHRQSSKGDDEGLQYMHTLV